MVHFGKIEDGQLVIQGKFGVSKAFVLRKYLTKLECRCYRELNINVKTGNFRRRT